MQDSELLIRMKKGDACAFEALYHKYNKILGFFLWGYLKSQDEVEEIIQDTFIKIWENKKNIDPKQNFKNYLFKISKHAFLNKLRRKNLEENYKQQTIKHFDEADHSTENKIVMADYEHLYARVVDDLPTRRRDIYLLSRNQGLTYGEIASTLNISKKTVEKQMSEALRYLKSKLMMENGAIHLLPVIYVLAHSI